MQEGFIRANPFDYVRLPRAPRKVVTTFSDAQMEALLGAIDTTTAAGFRDHTIILVLLDTALRISELTGLDAPDLYLEEIQLKVMGKGNRERIIPFGKQVQRRLWKYLYHVRPQPPEALFLTTDGRRLSRHRIQKRLADYGRKAGITGVRVSPHTLRHSTAVRFLRNGGDAFSLQRLLGHSSLQMTRHYCELADVDVQRMHTVASPVDNLSSKQLSRYHGSTPK
ncbi:tyrosine-type recombinase/integrase [Chloroflexota bacterium]